jgi:hypothetical protein
MTLARDERIVSKAWSKTFGRRQNEFITWLAKVRRKMKEMLERALYRH